jgi:hypothetical protein
MIVCDSKVQRHDEEEENTRDGRSSDKCCSDHSRNQVQKVKYTAVKVIQLVASVPHQVGEPAQVLIQFLENSS